MVTEAHARLVWEVWRLTHEIAGGFPPTWEALPGAVRVWFMGIAMPLLQISYGAAEAHRAVMDSDIPEGSPFAVADLQPFPLLPAVTRAAWTSMFDVAVNTKPVTPHVAGAFAA